MSSSALVPRSTIREIVAVFQRSEADVRASFATILEAQRRLNAVVALGSGRAEVRVDASRNGWQDNFDDPDHAVDRMARATWRCIVERLEIRKAMSIERWKKLDEALEKGDLPPISEDNICSFVEGCIGTLSEMLEEAIAEVFAWLRPRGEHSYGGRYKTNSRLEVGRRVVLVWMIETQWTALPRVRYDRTQELLALENVFNALDGRGQIARAHESELEQAIKASAWAKGETRLFRFRAFKNGNLHLEFRRLDLLERFNKIAGGKNLKPGMTIFP